MDYYGKGFAEVEFHNTGLYNLKGKFSYPEPNLGLYIFTQDPEDVGKFKAPTLRNIAVTAPYMHDGSIGTLSEAIDHYASGGRSVKSGSHAGDGSGNPNKSEFVKGFRLSRQEKEDLLAFLRSLTDETLLNNPRLSNPWIPSVHQDMMSLQRYRLRGNVAKVFPEDGSIALYHDEIPGLIGATKPPYTKEFLVANRDQLKTLKPGQSVSAWVRRQGRDFILDDLRPAAVKSKE